MSTRALLTYPTTNRKTGPMAAITLSKDTCPDVCPLKDGGCYAEYSPLRFHWDRITAGQAGYEWPTVVQLVSRLPRGVPLRVGQAGDLPGKNSWIDGAELLELVAAAGKRPVLAYTHKPVLGIGAEARHNRAMIRRTMKTGFTINLSANNGPHADFLADLHLSPVTVILPHSYGRRASSRHVWTETISQYRDRVEALEKEQTLLQTKRGRRVIVCPAMYTDTTCIQCMICAHDRNGAIVGFPAHGAARRKAELSCDVYALEEAAA